MKYSYLLLLMIAYSCNNDDLKNSIHTINYEGTNKVMQSVSYKNGKKNGAFLEYYKNGNLSDKQFFVNDTISDTAIAYYENGVIASIKVYKMGMKEGVCKNFNKEGHLYMETSYHYNKLNGSSNKYTYLTGKPLERLNYISGTRQGPQEYYHNNGQKKMFYYIKENHINDLEEWDEKGQKIDNDITISITERNRLLLENKLILIAKLDHPKVDDEVFEGMEYEPGVIVRIRSFDRVNDHFEGTWEITRGHMIMQKILIVAKRKSYYGNMVEKKITYNLSANNY